MLHVHTSEYSERVVFLWTANDFQSPNFRSFIVPLEIKGLWIFVWRFLSLTLDVIIFSHFSSRFRHFLCWLCPFFWNCLQLCLGTFIRGLSPHRASSVFSRRHRRTIFLRPTSSRTIFGRTRWSTTLGCACRNRVCCFIQPQTGPFSRPTSARGGSVQPLACIVAAGRTSWECFPPNQRRKQAADCFFGWNQAEDLLPPSCKDEPPIGGWCDTLGFEEDPPSQPGSYILIFHEHALRLISLLSIRFF